MGVMLGCSPEGKNRLKGCHIKLLRSAFGRKKSVKTLEENTSESGVLTFVFPQDITRAIRTRYRRKSEGHVVLTGDMRNVWSILV
jgi:hypothetical protein